MLVLLCSCVYSTTSSNDNPIDSNKGESQVKKVDIPRSHLGISLGMSWPKAKKILINRGYRFHSWGGKEDEYKVITVGRGSFAIGPKDQDKYSDVKINIFDNKVYCIALEPKGVSYEVIAEELKQKYPLEVEESEWVGSYGSGTFHKYYYSNGETGIFFKDRDVINLDGDDPSVFTGTLIQYIDVKIKAEREEFKKQVNAKKEKEAHERMSGF